MTTYGLGDIIKVPHTKCETMKAKVIGTDFSLPHPSGQDNWQYWLRGWDDYDYIGSSWKATKLQVAEWQTKGF